MNNPLAGFLPWILFWVISSPSTWEYATVAALLATLIMLYPTEHRGSIKLLDVVSIVFFGALTVAGLFLDREQLDWLEDYSQAISSGVLAVVVLGSLFFVPFTEQYARESVPEEFWDTPEFKHRNRVLTLVWGLVFAAAAICGVIAQQVDSGKDLWNWIAPVVLIVGGFKYTAWYREQAKAEGAPAAEPAPAG